MTAHRPCPPAPGPLEDYAARFDDHFFSLAQWLELLREQPAAAPHDGGVIVIDDSGDRKDGHVTAHVGRQWLGRLAKTDNGIVTVTTVRTDGRVYHPLHATP